jgi:hypothetical protein
MSNGTATCTLQNNYQDPVLGAIAVYLGSWPLTEYPLILLQPGLTSGVNFDNWTDWYQSNGASAAVINDEIVFISSP